MRQQVKFVFQIGYDRENWRFEQRIAQCASRLCGGCTTSIKQGWWIAGNITHADTFGGPTCTERCFELELTCELHKANRVYEEMRDFIAHVALRYSVDTDWVHVSEIPMTGRHFSVASLNATPTEKDAA